MMADDDDDDDDEAYMVPLGQQQSYYTNIDQYRKLQWDNKYWF